MTGLREKIQAADGAAYEEVAIPEWGFPLGVQGMSAEASLAIAEQAKTEREFVRLLLAGSIIDPKTREIVYDADSIGELFKKPRPIVTRLKEAALRVNGLDEEQVKKA